MRKRSLAALCTVTALGAVLAIPTAALAADSHPSGFKAWTDRTRLYLDFGSTALPKDLKVHLRKHGTDTRVATVTSFEFMDDEDPCMPSCEEDEGESGIRSTPLRLADLGTYSVDVEYDGTLGETILHKNKSTLEYRLIPMVTALEVVGTPQIEHRTVTVKADAVARDPRNDVDQPLPNGKLVLETSGAATPVATDASGHIETPFTFTGTEKNEGKYHAGVQVTLRPEGELKNSPLGQTRDVQVLRPLASITLDTAKVTGPDGGEAPLSGRITFKGDDGTMKPVPAGTPVDTGNGRVKTGRDGRFTGQVQVDGRRSGLLTISGSAWLQSTRTSVPVDPSTSAGFHQPVTADVSADKKVTVTGRLSRYDMPAPTNLKVLVEFSPGGTSPWITKATVDSAAPAGDSTGVVTATALPYPGPGTWRLRYAGTPAIPAGPAAQASGPVARSMTAFPEFNATPEPVKAGQPVTVTGKLAHKQPYGAFWSKYAGQQVGVYFRASGTTTWKLMGTTTTRSDGTFTRVFTAGKDGTWKARYEQVAPDHFAAASREDFVDVQ
ncbi:hypothetical protein ACIQV3_05365 [Streptomyces sp. NPDC099050]|uniref:hypothetical protein n=1 Tax=Streptomyces sp. NPDC099050 TaxID=3366100 RepID=UPI0037F5665C